MQAQLLGLLAKYPKLATLGDIANLRSNQISVAHLERIADAFNVQIPVTPEVTEAFVALLKGHNVNDVADLIQSPESMTDLITFFRGGFRGLVEKKRADEELVTLNPEDADFGTTNVLYIS